jgi:cobalt/nickel transport system permease protein
MTVMGALETIQPNFVRQPAARGRYALLAAGLAAVMLAAGGIVFASTAPDGIQQLAIQTGISGHARHLISTPFADYEASWLGSGWPAQAGAGLVGLALVGGVCVLIGRKR